MLSAFQKTHQKFFHFLFFVLRHAGLLYFFLLFLPILQGLAILDFSPLSMVLYFFWFNIHCGFQIFISLSVTPFFHTLLFTSFIPSIHISLSDPFNYFLPIPLPLLLSLLTFCVRPSPLPRINGLILLLKQMSIRAQ